jgi:hypothetical protein
MGDLEETMDKYFCSLFIVSIIIFSLFIPSIIADEKSSDSLSSYIQKQLSGVYNSEGFYTSSLTSDAVQTAIDHLQLDGGTVWVNGDIQLTSTIHPRSFTIINFLGNSIHVSANIAVVSYAKNTLFSILQNVIINLPYYYDTAVFLIDNEGMNGGNDAIDFNNIENVIINSEQPRKYTGIYMKLDGINEMWNNVFKNIIMHEPKTGILLEMTPRAQASLDGGVGFSNGNAFENIFIDSFINGIKFIKPSWYSYGGFNCNYFHNIDFQYCSQTKQGITGVFGNGNTFMDISMSAWEQAVDLEYIYQIYTQNVKLYVDQWITNHLLFDAPSNINVLETGCPASSFSIDVDDTFYKVDFSLRGVHTSNGNFYDQSSSYTIQMAIDNMPLIGGIIYVNEPVFLSQPVYLKSNVELDFLGYTVTLTSSSDGFIFQNGVKSATLKHMLISGSGGITQDYILFQSTGSTNQDMVEDNQVAHVVMEGNGYTGIHLMIDGIAGIWNNTFSDIHLYKSNGIYLEMTYQGIELDKYGWANGNRFEFICNDEFYKGIEFLLPSLISRDDKAGFNCNLFKHVLYQIEPNSHHGVMDVSGDSNTFMHIIFWDNIYGSMQYFINIHNKAKNSKIWADWDEDFCYDKGIDTIIEEGRPLFQTTGFYWDDECIEPIRSFFLFPLFSKITLLFPMLKKMDTFFFNFFCHS